MQKKKENRQVHGTLVGPNPGWGCRRNGATSAFVFSSNSDGHFNFQRSLSAVPWLLPVSASSNPVFVSFGRILGLWEISRQAASKSFLLWFRCFSLHRKPLP